MKNNHPKTNVHRSRGNERRKLIYKSLKESSLEENITPKIQFCGFTLWRNLLKKLKPKLKDKIIKEQNGMKRDC